MVVDPLMGIGPVEKVQGNFQFLEGPQWIAAKGSLLFTDIPANTIFEILPGAAATVFRNPSGNANGLGLDSKGLLITAEHSGRRVSRTMADGSVVTVVDLYQGKKLNSPNDLIGRSDGNIYFTDPPYGLADPGLSELGFFGVFRVNPQGTIELVANDMIRPNGIALSPDEKTLYVDDTNTGELRTYALDAAGLPTAPQKLTTTSPGPDGMALDSLGNLYVSTSTGVQVLRPDGTEWGTIAVPEQPANCAFGGADGKTLFVTARKSLYQVKMQVKGL